MSNTIVVFILLFTYVLFDVQQRNVLESYGAYAYPIAIFAELAFIIAIGQILSLVKSNRYRLLLTLSIAFLIGLVYILQYASERLYGKFISTDDIAIIWNNLSYWINHFGNLTGDIKASSLLSLTFPVFIYLLLQQFGKFNPRPWLIAALLIFSGCLGVLKWQHKIYLLPPALNFSSQSWSLITQDQSLLVKLGEEKQFPDRQLDPIGSVTLRDQFNILVILHESLDTDFLSLFGHADETTPFQKKFFNQSYLFPNAVSNATSTDASLGSIFTGLDKSQPHLERSSLIWQYAKAAKLHTFYISSHWLDWNGGMDKDFLSPKYIDSQKSPLYASASLGSDDFVTARQFNQHLADRDTSQAFFGVVHFSGTHYPYHVSPEYKKYSPSHASFDPQNINALINQYKNAILRTDAAVEKLIEGLKENNQLDNTIIISTADHGEAFYQHQQFFHGNVFWQEGLRVPLLIHIPSALKHLFKANELENLKQNSHYFISNVDIFSTILDLYQIPAAKKLSGFSLLKPYPNTWINIFMSNEYMATINSHSGIKYFLDNSTRVLRRTALRKDPQEKSATEHNLSRSLSYPQFIDQVKNKLAH